MKYTAHVPIEQYGFISADIESGSPQEAYEAYIAIKAASQGLYRPDIPEKELNTVIDKMLQGKTIESGIEIYNRMSDRQRYAVQVLKRGMKRNTSDQPQDLEDQE